MSACAKRCPCGPRYARHASAISGRSRALRCGFSRTRLRSRTVLDAAREQVAAACARLAKEGLVVGTSGNVSMRAEGHVIVTPTGGVFGEMSAEDMSVVTPHGTVVEGPAPTSELGLHLLLYERKDAGAVVHTHAPYATALSCVVDEVPPVHYSMLMFGGSLKVAPYATFGTEELARNVESALDERTACLMQNYGHVGYCHDLDYALAA